MEEKRSPLHWPILVCGVLSLIFGLLTTSRENSFMFYPVKPDPASSRTVAYIAKQRITVFVTPEEEKWASFYKNGWKISMAGLATSMLVHHLWKNRKKKPSV